MRSSQHKEKVSKACHKKHVTVNIILVALCSFVCQSVWGLAGEFQLPGFLQEENPVGLCACVPKEPSLCIGYHLFEAGIQEYSIQLTNSFQKSLAVCCICKPYF